MTRGKSRGGPGKSGEAPRRVPTQPSGARPAREPARPKSLEGAPTAATNAAASVPSFRRPGAEVAVLFGFHAVREALRCGRREILDLYATKAASERLAEEIASAGLRPHIVEAETLSRRLGVNAVHQGVMIEARPLPDLDLSEIPSRSGVVLVLDQITDPHNVGAILRTAAAFCVDALVTTDRHAPEMAGVLAKAASGGLEHVAIVSVVNLARTLEKLGDMGYLRVGLDSAGAMAFAEAPLRRPLALVLGGEGKGMRRLTRENCDLVARLDMPGAIKSLNVSNACASALTMLHMQAAR